MKKDRKKSSLRRGDVEIREDLEDASGGNDLSYLSEFPQMSGYEGVKAGIPPPRTDEKKKREKHLSDES
jgi:hypothetical protein